ncbi:MAG: DUF6247 family protein [Pseudonocardiaceae bacterium]
MCGATAAATPGPRRGRSGPSFSDATPAEVRAALIPEETAEFDQQWPPSEHLEEMRGERM